MRDISFSLFSLVVEHQSCKLEVARSILAGGFYYNYIDIGMISMQYAAISRIFHYLAL